MLRWIALGISLLAFGLMSCVTPSALSPVELDFFAQPSDENPWARKIANWQARHSLDPMIEGAAPRTDSDLAGKYEGFMLDLREQIATETVAWVQANSRRYYRPDGDYDHWATLGEVIESGGDDCDGLDLLTFVLLRRLGFAEDEVYRAIVVEEGTGQHHMVTLWFDRGHDSDPFVLDPTGVVTSKMVRLADVPDWEPIELFDENRHFVVTTRPMIAASAD